MSDRDLRQRHRLGSPRFGDLVAIVNADTRRAPSVRQGRVAIGIIVHGESTVSGHGRGIASQAMYGGAWGDRGARRRATGGRFAGSGIVRTCVPLRSATFSNDGGISHGPRTMNIRKESIAAQATTAPASAVLAEFSLDNTPCLVVMEDSRLGRARDTADAAAGRWLGNLDLDGRRYAVFGRPVPVAPIGGADVDPLAALTAREQQIVGLVCLGCVNKQIAHRLRISEYTVKTYLKQIFCKLNVHSRSAMVFRCASRASVDILQSERHG
jgi:DNA-binding CsgD family transcriptional regulator